jgi:protein-S-isoprenylcysteine O-methyltransferase Ste14
MGIAGLSILVLQFLICAGGIEPVAGFPDGLVLAGAVLEIAGILAAYFVRGRYLGRFWSGSVEIQPDHHIVEHGPYRFIRHPVYALTLLIYPGVALAFPVGWVWLACGIMLAGYLLLTEYEDRFLARNLPGYAGYRARTRWKILPGIW